jgi:hypothetical protein
MALSKIDRLDCLSDDEDFCDISLDDADYLTHDALSQRVDDLTFQILHITAPDLRNNPQFQILFSERSLYDSISACSPLEFAPGLHDVLSSPDPPSIAFFKSLPFISGDRSWAIYAVVMEKDGCPTKIYIGSGTNSDYGVSARANCYYPGCPTLPHYVKLAFQQGYHIAHIGLLCWSHLPTPGLVPRVRARFLCVEALFTCLFHAAIPKSTDVYYDHLLLWERASVTCQPLCSHLPLSEKIMGDIEMSEEELEIVAALKKAAAARRIKEWRAAKRAKDVDAYQANDRKMKNAWTEKNRGRVNKTAAKVRGNAITSKRFHCKVCSADLQSQHALDLHLATQAHADREAGIEVLETSSDAVRIKAARDAAKAAGLHRCEVCDRSFGLKGYLQRHLGQAGHQKRVAKAAAEAAAST